MRGYNGLQEDTVSASDVIGDTSLQPGMTGVMANLFSRGGAAGHKSKADAFPWGTGPSFCTTWISPHSYPTWLRARASASPMRCEVPSARKYYWAAMPFSSRLHFHMTLMHVMSDCVLHFVGAGLPLACRAVSAISVLGPIHIATPSRY